MMVVSNCSSVQHVVCLMCAWRDVRLLVCRCRDRVPALLSKLRLQHGSVEVHGTPRRLAVLVHDLAPAQTPQESKVWSSANHMCGCACVHAWNGCAVLGSDALCLNQGLTCCTPAGKRFASLPSSV